MSSSKQALTPQEFDALATAAVAAPSPDNSQPWVLHRETDALRIEVCPSHEMFFDYAGWASQMSLGAAVENVLTTAPNLGLDSAVELQSTESGSRRARIRFQRPWHTEPSAHHEAVLTRQTHRGRFGRTPVPQDVRAKLEEALADFSDFRLHWSHTAEAREAVIEAACGADRVRYTHPAIHRDFHDVLRFGAAQDTRRDGLAADTLGIEKFLLPSLRMSKPWALTRGLNALGVHHFMVWRGTTLPLRQAPLLGVMTCKRGSDAFVSGRAMERLWLAATAAGLSFQPFGSLPLLLRRCIDGNGEGLSLAHQAQLQHADAAWRRAAGNTEDELVIIFRMGYAEQRAPRARRRPLASFWAPATVLQPDWSRGATDYDLAGLSPRDAHAAGVDGDAGRHRPSGTAG